MPLKKDNLDEMNAGEFYTLKLIITHTYYLKKNISINLFTNIKY